MEQTGPIFSDETIVKFKTHFLITMIAGIIGIVVIFVNLRSDVVQMLTTVQRQQSMLESNQGELSALKVHYEILDYKLDSILDRIPKKEK